MRAQSMNLPFPSAWGHSIVKKIADHARRGYAAGRLSADVFYRFDILTIRACMTSPSVIVPLRYFGAESRIGKTGAMKPLVCETNVVRIVWKQISHHRAST